MSDCSNSVDGARDQSTWVFGYGSLVWRPNFDFCERVAARLHGWRRRFWQGSTDHRGTPGAPGRVVTLERAADEWCGGVVYRLDKSKQETILAGLDVREQGGYELVTETCKLSDDRSIDALVYVATPDNSNYLGPATTTQLVEQIRRSRGPSGANIEYVLELADALEGLGLTDRHVSELAAALRAESVQA